MGGTTSSYALFCVAKDLYLGTTPIALGDLADPELIPPKLFGVICNAIAIRRYVVDCLSKKVKINNGERPKYYVENSHPAIIDSVTFGRLQKKMVRRNGKPKVKQKGTKTEQGKYSSKYALTDLLFCGECGTPYRRCTWTVKKKIVWRCISRLDF